MTHFCPDHRCFNPECDTCRDTSMTPPPLYYEGVQRIIAENKRLQEHLAAYRAVTSTPDTMDERIALYGRLRRHNIGDLAEAMTRFEALYKAAEAVECWLGSTMEGRVAIEGAAFARQHLLDVMALSKTKEPT